VLERPVVPDRPPPSPAAGAVLGVVAGLLLTAVWRYGAADLAVAVSLVFAGLLAVLLAGAPGWRPFGTAAAAAAAVVVGIVVVMG
jgi:hypothetical protein